MTGSEVLRAVMHLPPNIAQVTRTVDGHYLGRASGDCGFNAFFGRPNPRPQPATVTLGWEAFRTAPRACVRSARASGVDLRDFLPKSRGAE